MIRCQSCSHENPPSSRFCGSCATPLPAIPDATAATAYLPQQAAGSGTASAPRLASSSAIDEGRFLPGTVLAGRYRVVGLLGRGGMGEVYRATDLTLGQVVALKFLPETTASDERALARFYNEVRVARQVTHPNVCRVYDIGEVEGLHYISMEYIDGEDLAVLLRRIGRLPADKAVEIARKVCAGLAAAHDKGVLHRDLKPANIMIDGRGQVVIMDFGLAGLANQLSGDVRSGTPAYMSPEQLAGREVTVKSDIYALGLLLYEVFTGRRAFEASSLMELMRMQEQATPVSLSSMVKDLDPAVERTVMRCLQPEPRNRPPSALAVAAALPGGDPLAAALAAGETPSPDLVAAAGETEGLRPRIAVACLAAVFVLLAAYLAVFSRNSFLERSNLENTPDALVRDAMSIIHKAGYTAKPADTAWHLSYANELRQFLKKNPDMACRRWTNPGDQFPALVQLWYRQSPRYIIPNGLGLSVNDPPEDVVGMVRIHIDSFGRLLSFRAVPPELEKNPGPPRIFDWNTLFSAAGLDIKRFQPAEPEWLPPFAFDQRAAWTGSSDVTPAPLRVEAASWNGRPVFFRVIGPWSHPYRMTPVPPTRSEQTGQIVTLIVIYAAIIGAGIIARYQARKSRGDYRGALRLGLA
jgi:serine/threonine-protein kinase